MQDKEHIFWDVPDDSPYLEHYGIKGMKWGIRKDGKSQGFQYGKIKKAAKQRVTTAKNRAKTNAERKRASRNRSQLSEAELDRRISRLKKERELRQLTDSEVRPGRAFVRDFLKTNGKKIAGPVAVGVGMYAVKNYLSSGGDHLAPWQQGPRYNQWNWADAARMIKLDKK